MVGERREGAEGQEDRQGEPSAASLGSIAEEIEHRFHELIHGRWDVAWRDAPADVFVVGHEIWVEMDLPGVPPEGVSARLEGGMLAIEAIRRVAAPPAEARAARLERRRGPVSRRIALPRAMPAARLEIQLEAGVLRVRVRPEPAE